MVRNIFSYLLKRSKPNSLFIKQSRNYAATPKTFKAAYYQNKFDFKIKEKELEKLNKSQVIILLFVAMSIVIYLLFNFIYYLILG